VAKYHVFHNVEGQAAILTAPSGKSITEIIKGITSDRNIVVTPVFIPEGCREAESTAYPVVIGALQFSSDEELITYSVHYTDQIIINFHLDPQVEHVEREDIVPEAFSVPVRTILKLHQLTTERVSQCVSVWAPSMYGTETAHPLWIGFTHSEAVKMLRGPDKLCVEAMGVKAPPHYFKHEFGYVRAKPFKPEDL